jgi:hypothetical protein
MLTMSSVLNAQSPQMGSQAQGKGQVFVTDEAARDAQPFTDLGYALAGEKGEPVLRGTGDLTAGSRTSLALSESRAGTLALLMVAADANPTPFKGGVLVPVPSPLQLLLATDQTGGIRASFAWPEGIPAGFEIIMQYVIYDPAAIQKFALSNALMARAS